LLDRNERGPLDSLPRKTLAKGVDLTVRIRMLGVAHMVASTCPRRDRTA
jgi:hypothetical protein